MFFAIAVLLIQPHVAPQLSFSAEKIELIQPVRASVNSNSISGAEVNEESSVSATLATASSESGGTADPMIAVNSETLPDAPVPVSPVGEFAPLTFIKAGKMTVSVSQLQAENRRNEFLWKGLTIASSGAATFDAWTTRRAITQSGAQELNSLLRPFAGNRSLYAAIQIGPALMDFAGKKMMYSRHNWVRRMWWVPQSASFVSSIFCGAHNLSYR